MAIGDKKSVLLQEDIGQDGGVPPYLHASQHAASGTDPITPPMIGAASNPNLLDNWYFADPIDQRGGWVVKPNAPYYIPNVSGVVDNTDTYYKIASWAGTAGASNAYFYKDDTKYVVDQAYCVRGYVGAGYTIDRWVVEHTTAGGTSAVSLADDGVKFVNTSTINILLRQYFDKVIPAGTTYTFSVLVTEKTGSVYMGYGNKALEVGVTSYTGTLSKDTVPSPYIWISGSGSVTIAAVKYELGSTQTLAHQDADGNWVLNDPPPNKQQELAKCQRYQVDIGGFYPVIQTFGGNGYWFAIQLPEDMRISPNVSTSGMKILSGGSVVDGFTLAAQLVRGRTVVVQATPATATTLTEPMLSVPAGSFADANL